MVILLVISLTPRVNMDIYESISQTHINMEVPEFYISENGSESDNQTCENFDFDISDFFVLLADSENLRQNTGCSILLIIAYTVIFIIGMIGNIIVIAVIALKPPLRTVTNMFLLNLAVADLLVIIFCVPATLLANLFRPWILGPFMCKAVAYVQGVAVCASACSLATLSLDRCNIIYRSMERHPGISRHQALVAILLIWMFSSLITLPWLFAFEEVESDCQVYCIEVWSTEYLGKVYFLVAHLICCYCIPLGIICSSNIGIWCYVSQRQPSQTSVSIRRVHRRKSKGVRRTIIFVTLAFLICWLPLYVLATCIKFSSLEEIKRWGDYLAFVLPFAQWLGSLNSCINPVIYAFMNKKFRKGFQGLLCFPCRDSYQHNVGSNGRSLNSTQRQSTFKQRMTSNTKTTYV